MSDSPKDKAKQAADGIDLGLNTLFGALSDAIGDMVSRLDEGTDGTVTRNHEFQTPKGPIRAQAGVRLRMGGMEVGTEAPKARPKPVNPDRAAPEQAPRTAASPLSYDIFEEHDGWVFTADMPGVQAPELALHQEETRLHLRTTGQRQYEADVDLKKPFSLQGIDVRLKNGVLSLQIPKGPA